MSCIPGNWLAPRRLSRFSLFPQQSSTLNHNLHASNEDLQLDDELEPPNSRLDDLLVPRKVLSLVGRKGAGKTVLLNSVATDQWISHETRRELLRPALRQAIIRMARQVIASMLARDYSFADQSQAVQEAVGEVLRSPLQSVSRQSMVTLHELNVFKQLIRSHPMSPIRFEEGLINAYDVLVEQFPINLFLENEYIPENHMLQLCRPPSVGVCQANFGKDVKIVDSPGATNDINSPFHEYATQLNDRSMLVYVAAANLLFARRRIELEAELFERVYGIACDKRTSAIGLAFTGMDKYHHGLEHLYEALETILSRANAVPMDKRIPIRIALVAALDEDSAHTSITELSVDQPSLFTRCGDPFISCGVLPHQDMNLSATTGVPVMWLRSVFGGLGKSTRVRDLSWSPPLYGILSKGQRDIVKTILLIAHRKESQVHTLPSTVLWHILSFTVSLHREG